MLIIDKTEVKLLLIILNNEKIRIIGVFFLDKGSGSGIFPDPDPVFSRIRVTQKDRIQPDPDPQHCRIEIIQFLWYFCCVY